MVSVECIVQTDDVLGEVPLWHPTENALYWIDLFQRFTVLRSSIAESRRGHHPRSSAHSRYVLKVAC